MKLLLAIARGVSAAWLLLFTELFLLLLLRGDQLASHWEFFQGSAGAVPAWLLLSVMPGVAAGLLSVALPWKRGLQRHLPAFGLSLVVALAAYGVGGGRHLPTLQVRVVFAVFAGLSTYAVSASCLPWLGSTFQRWRLSAGGCLLLVALALDLLNRTVLVRLYEAFHILLSIGSYLAACLGLLLLLSALAKGNRVSRYRLPAALVVAFVCLVSISSLNSAASHLGRFDNYRWWLLENSPSLAWGAKLSQRLVPAPKLDKRAIARPLGARGERSGLNLEGRNFLLITVDALRADYLGSYGQKLPLTPNLDALAAEGAKFSAAYAPTPHTSYSLSSLMTGKYMRPLILQGAGLDSQTLPDILRTYGYKTAGFYPPAVFFIDGPRFETFSTRHLGFEYFKVEFLEGEPRVQQFRDYLSQQNDAQSRFTWVHLFGPHEPYIKDERFDFGERAIERYASEVKAADATIGSLIATFRADDPEGVVLVTADHGEEFGEHGGRYHGTSVFEEQVRVPLLISAPGKIAPQVILEPVQTIDLMPTLLRTLKIPIPARVRGRDLTPLLNVKKEQTSSETLSGIATSETDDFSLLARGSFRLICNRRAAACRLFDLKSDPLQTRDQSRKYPDIYQSLLKQSRALAAQHGTLESQGLRAEGKGWPAAIMLGISGDAAAAVELALLLDDADVDIRRKSAELLLQLAKPEQKTALRLALSREDDNEARTWEALALSRLGLSVPLVRELLRSPQVEMRRWAALALAEQENKAGLKILIGWYLLKDGIDFEQSKRVTIALGQLGSKKAMPALVARLTDVRLRPFIADALAKIGDKNALGYLTRALNKELFTTHRPRLADAMLSLGANDELIVPLRRFMGVPDPMEESLQLALDAGILAQVGGPSSRELARARQFLGSGVHLEMNVPGLVKNKSTIGGKVALTTVRVLFQVTTGKGGGTLYIAPAKLKYNLNKNTVRVRNQPEISADNSLVFPVLVEGAHRIFYADLPPEYGARPGHRLALSLFSQGDLELEAIASVSRRPELAPPPAQPWAPAEQ